jgi:hypothetical protein
MNQEIEKIILSKSDEELDKFIATTDQKSLHYKFAVQVRQDMQLKKLAKPTWITILTLIFTVLCFLAAFVAAWPVLSSWLK